MDAWPLYRYQAQVIRVVDGDTVDIDLDLGCFISVHKRCRLLGINAPELHDPDPDIRGEAIRAKDVLTQRLLGHDIYVKTDLDKDDKYGRLLITIYEPADMLVSLNRRMVEWGLAIEYIGWERV